MKSALPKNTVINHRNFKKVTQLLDSCEFGNCWGTTLFLLGQSKKRWPVGGYEMDQFLQNKTRKIKQPKIGDILVLRYPNKRTAKQVEQETYEEAIEANFLSHTALCIGKDKFLHQVGYCGPIREHNFKQIMKIYYKSTKIEYARVQLKKKSVVKKRKKI
jgi:hypothetical protein